MNFSQLCFSSRQCYLIVIAVLTTAFLTYSYMKSTQRELHQKTFDPTISHVCPHKETRLSESLIQMPPDLDKGRQTPDSEVEYVRAVLLYFPAGHNFEDQFSLELRWLYRSWQEMLKTQPKNWRTDIVVVVEKPVEVCKILKCSAISRKTSSETNSCRCIAGYNPNIKDFEDYNVVNSLSNMLWANTNLEQYDWILRTDIDTFLTPAFSSWKPKQTVVGGGGYIQGADLLTAHRLKRVSEYLGLDYKDMNNIGATWYGPVKLLQKAAEIAIESMRYLKAHEFTKLEKSPKFGVQGWPEWHFGVLSMYGGHLAMNHLAAHYDIKLELESLDYYTTSKEPTKKHPHLHAWHTDELFSKFVFFAGKYRNVTLDSLDISICKDYCLYMALDSSKDYKWPG